MLHLKTPENILEIVGKWFDANKKIAFLSTLVVGFITNIILFTIMIMSPDGLWNSLIYESAGFEITLGRWALMFFEKLRNNISMVTVTTVYSIFITAVIAVFIVDFYELKSKISAFFTGAILGVSPCLAMTMLYSYTSDLYCWAFLLAVISAWLICRNNRGLLEGLFSAIAIMVSMALYQSYIGVTVGLCISKVILNSIKSVKDKKEILKDIGYRVLVVLVGCIFYYISVKVTIYHYNLILSDYRGTDEVSLLNIISNLIPSILSAYKAFFGFFICDNNFNNSNFNRSVLWELFFGAIIVSYLYIIVKNKADNKKEKILNIVFNFIIFIILPIGINIINLMVPQTEYYPLNSTQMLLVVPLGFAILESLEVERGSILKWISVVTCLIICITYYLSINASYLLIRIKYNQAYATTLRAVDRLENTEGYEPHKSWLFAGIIDGEDDNKISNLEKYTLNSMDIIPIFHRDFYGGQASWYKFIEQFLGITPVFCTQEQFNEIIKSDEFKNMNVFPEEGSTKEINGVMVVKFEKELKLVLE